jgi:hypothetical protein
MHVRECANSIRIVCNPLQLQWIVRQTVIPQQAFKQSAGIGTLKKPHEAAAGVDNRTAGKRAAGI